MSRGAGETTILSNRIITLTTDFGLKDPYVAEMKAAILQICPEAVLVDITHEIEKFNVQMGAFILSCVVGYFPEGTIHVAVIDPSVGTKRRPIVIETQRSFLVGPDNGVLILASEREGIRNYREIVNRRLTLPKISTTFHGRDIFAPVAAHLAKGTKTTEIGPEINKVARPLFTKVTDRNSAVNGEVLHIDDFGNIITNITEVHISRPDYSDWLEIKLAGRKLKLRLCKTYGGAQKNELLALIGSHGYLEIAVNQGSAVGKLGAKQRDRVSVSPV